ncbi:hypothetical protein [Spirochaeta cellobiosiphila]|uniref:hypothetical protein n=1 Tax=Spirochaeta cellobiosiphila TaxID=504483 RepID=UPI0003F892DB|nr:hypothetical protein [Spirochaeta cellobiosiphila]
MSMEPRERIGEFLIRQNELSFEQAEQVLAYQNKNPRKRFGEIAVELGFVGYDQIYEYLRGQNEL